MVENRKRVRRVRGRKIALMMLVLALLAPTVSARYEGVRGPGMYYGGAVGGERFDSVNMLNKILYHAAL